mmetsp:Transcript_14212/g.17474  ORF Transcript_14212/g.17474 Transcript_14212/m.17474 type:complete len:278 (-) Transcript_14212:57-890(-)
MSVAVRKASSDTDDMAFINKLADDIRKDKKRPKKRKLKMKRANSYGVGMSNVFEERIDYVPPIIKVKSFKKLGPRDIGTINYVGTEYKDDTPHFLKEKLKVKSSKHPHKYCDQTCGCTNHYKQGPIEIGTNYDYKGTVYHPKLNKYTVSNGGVKDNVRIKKKKKMKRSVSRPNKISLLSPDTPVVTMSTDENKDQTQDFDSYTQGMNDLKKQMALLESETLTFKQKMNSFVSTDDNISSSIDNNDDINESTNILDEIINDIESSNNRALILDKLNGL